MATRTTEPPATVPAAAAVITLTMTPALAAQIHSVLVEGYRAMRYDSQATPEWCRDILVTIDRLAGQLTAGGHRA